MEKCLNLCSKGTEAKNNFIDLLQITSYVNSTRCYLLCVVSLTWAVSLLRLKIQLCKRVFRQYVDWFRNFTFSSLLNAWRTRNTMGYSAVFIVGNYR